MRADRDKNRRWNRRLPCLVAGIALIGLVCTLVPQPGQADETDRVRELRSTESIMPLSQILRTVEKQYPGTLLEVELEEEKGLVIYEMELLGRDKVVHKIKVDAKNGRILSMDRKD